MIIQLVRELIQSPSYFLKLIFFFYTLFSEPNVLIVRIRIYVITAKFSIIIIIIIVNIVIDRMVILRKRT